MKIALITGASSGLGREFVTQLRENPEIEEFWVVARRKDRLEALQSITTRKVVPIALDLTKAESISSLQEKLTQEQPDIRMLICAAGLGKIGDCTDLSLADQDRMIQLNIQACVDVTTIALPFLSKGSEIIEVGSVAGFQPLPGLNVYSASKAFIQSYTKGLHYELKKSGIHVTCLCPYWIQDTEFIGVAQKTSQKYYKHAFLASHSAEVVRCALQASKENRWVTTPGAIATLDRIATKVIPDALTVRFMGMFRYL